MSDDKQLEEARNRLAWRESGDRRKTRIIDLCFLIMALLLALFVSVTPGKWPKQNSAEIFSELSAGFLVVLCFMGSTQYTRDTKRRFFDKRLIEKSRELGDQEADLLDEEQLRLGALWRLTEERLRIYHEIATRQAQASFRNAQWAIAGGFIVVIASAVTAFYAGNVTITVVVGVLGTAGAALSAYIGRTFLRLQESAATHLRSYFTQPQEQFRYLAAERLLALLENGEQKGKSVDQLIQAMVSSHGQHTNQASK